MGKIKLYRKKQLNAYRAKKRAEHELELKERREIEKLTAYSPTDEMMKGVDEWRS